MELTAALLDLCKGVTQPVIAIDGPAGGGKTTLAQNLALAFATSLSTTVIPILPTTGVRQNSMKQKKCRARNY